MTSNFRVLAVAFLCLWAFPAAADATLSLEQWSFADHPNPDPATDLTKEEQAIFLAPDDPAYSKCKNITGKDYLIYLKRYPEYVNYGDLESRMRAWREYSVSHNETTGHGCFFSIVLNDIYNVNLQRSHDFYFCGVVSQPPATDEERNATAVAEEFLTYTESDDPAISEEFLRANRNLSWIDLNPDIVYFLIHKVDLSSPGLYDVPDSTALSHKLSPERLAFLDNAIARNNLEAVLATTPPCPKRENRHISLLQIEPELQAF